MSEAGADRGPDPGLLAELADAFLTSRLSDGQRAELAAAGRVVVVGPGDVVFVEGEPADDLWILLEGEIRLTRLVGREVQVMATMTTPGQWAGGLRAWGGDGDAIGYRGTGTAVVESRFLALPSTELARLVEAWFPFGMHLTTGIFQTVRGIDAVVRQRASLIALGTMAAGLAHEINNPAAAAQRAVAALRTAQADMVAAVTALTPDQIRALASLPALAPPPARSALAVARAEDEIGDLLTSQGVAEAWTLAPALVAAGFDAAACEQVSSVVGPAALEAGLRWVATARGADHLLDELADATRRISDLVGAVQTFSQVDRASRQRVDVHEGIESTLVMLGHKLGAVTVVRDLADDLPALEADAGQLNQVWTNLIDNAIDAVAEGDGPGTVTVRTRAEGDAVVVEVADTGPGIPPAIQERIFEAFFTTKDVGRGTGLGLDITRRIIDDHAGTIALTTGDAGTTFTVTLPLAG